MQSSLTIKNNALYAEPNKNDHSQFFKKAIFLSTIITLVIVLWYQALVIILWPQTETHLSGQLPLNYATDSTVQDGGTSNQLEKPSSIHPQFTFTIVRGDTLSKLFSKAGVTKAEMQKVLAADLDVLALDTVTVGNKIEFWIDKKRQLQKLVVIFNRANKVIYSRYTDGTFQAKNVISKGLWQPRVFAGYVSGSFYSSAEKQGLTPKQISRISDLLAPKINFKRDIQKGDKFKVLVEEQHVAGELTGASRIKGVYIETKKGHFSIFQYKDGNFYDDKGRSLEAGFQRLPLQHPARISSRFNPYRVHPITGRITAHNGVDFAVGVGTKVIATGDGIVRLVTNHPYAGKYIVIEHNERYTTRYLHLSRSLVRVGQKVKRGQVIALSGNTGRTTGPHLHYEFKIDGKPVNPLTVNIPVIKKLNEQDEQQFVQTIKKCKLMMDLV